MSMASFSGRRRREVARHLAADAESAALVDAYRPAERAAPAGPERAGRFRSRRTGTPERSSRIGPAEPDRRQVLGAAAAVALAAGTGGWWLSHRQNLARMADEIAQQAVLAHLSYADDDAASAVPRDRCGAAECRDWRQARDARPLRLRPAARGHVRAGARRTAAASCCAMPARRARRRSRATSSRSPPGARPASPPRRWRGSAPSRRSTTGSDTRSSAAGRVDELLPDRGSGFPVRSREHPKETSSRAAAPRVRRGRPFAGGGYE